MDAETPELRAAGPELLLAPAARRDWRLWNVLLCTLVLKLGATWLWLGLQRIDRWKAFYPTFDLWLEFAQRVQRGAVPYVDFAWDAPILAGTVQWLIVSLAKLGSSGQLLQARPLALWHASLMAAVDLVNVGLFYQLVRRIESRSALRASLVFAASLSALALGPLRVDGVVITCFLLAARARHRPRAVGCWAAIGCGLHWGAGWLFLAHELQRSLGERDRRSWRASVGSFVGVLLVLYVPYLTGAPLLRASPALQFSWFNPARPLAPDSVPGLLALWFELPMSARGWAACSAALGVWALARLWRTRSPQPFMVALAALALWPQPSTSWTLWLTPLWLVIALCSAPGPRARLLWLFAFAELATLVGWALLPAARPEFGEFTPGGALARGGPYTLLWTLAVACRWLCLAAFARQLASGLQLESAPTLLAWPRFDAAVWTTWLHQPALRLWLAAAVILLQASTTFTIMRDRPIYSDEGYHVGQVERFCRGDRKLDGLITMLPGYHVVSAAIGKTFGDCSRVALRRQNMIWGLAIGALGCAILFALGSARPASRTLSLYFLPIAFPYYFVAFTDILALALVLLTVYLALQRSWGWAGVIGTLGIFVRQTNALALVLIGLIAWFELDRARPFRAWAWEFVRTVWSAGLGLLAFGCVIVVNRGIAIGDRAAHQAGLHIGNVVFTLLLLGLVALPANLERFWSQRRELGSAGFLCALLGLYCVYRYSFKIEHFYNLGGNSLRNDLLVWATRSGLTKTLFFVPVAFGFAALWVTPLVRRSHWALVPTAFISLVPEPLVEQRYSIVPLALWLLLRRDGSSFSEALSAFANILLSTLLIHLIVTETWMF